MEIKTLCKDIQSIEAILGEKKRICTYGAGNLASDIEKLLRKCGHHLDYYIVDDWYYNKSAETGSSTGLVLRV